MRGTGRSGCIQLEVERHDDLLDRALAAYNSTAFSRRRADLGVSSKGVGATIDRISVLHAILVFILVAIGCS